MTRPVVVTDDRSGPAGARLLDAPEVAGLGRLAAEVLVAEGVGAGAEAGLHLVPRAEIAELNAAHMGLDGPTDVLSFPVDGASATDGGLVGDVLVCPEVAASQAADHAGTLLDECRLLVVHGTLHLCGWDHPDEVRRRAMWDRERELMDHLGVSPTGDPWGAG